MPDIDGLMQEWPTQFEELLKETSVPSADADVDLATYTDIACGNLDAFSKIFLLVYLFVF